MSTYARLFIAFSKSLRKIVEEYSDQPPKLISPELPPILSEQEVNDAKSHPHNRFLQSLFKAQASCVEVDHLMIENKIELEKQRIFIEEALDMLAQKKVKTDPKNQGNLADITTTLETQYKTLNTIDSELKEKAQQLVSVDDQLSKLGPEQNKEWVTYRDQTLEELTEAFHSTGISLNEMEIGDLKKQDTFAAIRKRFKDLDIPLPLPDIKGGHLPYSTYFELKAYLAIQSALSRNLLPHSHADILTYMSKLKDVFKKSNDVGTQLFTQENKTTESLIQSNITPALASLNTRHEQMKTLNYERVELLKAVTPEDLKVISEKTDKRVSEITPAKISLRT